MRAVLLMSLAAMLLLGAARAQDARDEQLEKELPKEFKTKPGSGYVLHVWKREKQ